MSTAIAEVQTAVAEFDKVAAGIAELKKLYGGVVYDVKVPKEMEAAKAARAAVREPRYEVERLRKAAKAPILKLGKDLDGRAEKITEELLAIEEPIDQQIKLEEQRKDREKQAKIEAEQKRVAAIQERIAEIRGVIEVCTRYNCAATLIAEHASDIERIVIDESFEEFRQQAEDAKTSTLAKLREAHAAALSREEEARKAAEAQAELAKLRAEVAAREAKERAEREERDRQERLKREAEEKAAREAREAAEKAAREKLAAEQAEIARQQKEAQDKIDAENRRLAAERAELERQQREAREKAEAEAARKRTEEEAERKRKEEAERLAKKAKFPGTKSIVDALMQHFGVTEQVVNNWLSQLTKEAA